MVNFTDGGIAYAQVAFQGQRRHPGHGLAEEVQGQEPLEERELGVLEQNAGDERSLPAADFALEGLADLDA